MQPPNSDSERPSESISDGGRDIEQRSYEKALRLAYALLSHVANRSVHLEHGKPVNLSVNMKGSGGTNA
jgi:hypothetical protein